MNKVLAKDKKHLQELIKEAFDKNITDLNFIDTSQIRNMRELFCNAKGNFNVSDWDVSNVTNMSKMFFYAEDFNQPLDKWDVSKVKSMHQMFQNAMSFNQSLNSWDVSRVKRMHLMFQNARNFDQPLDKWNTVNVRSMGNMFCGATSFNQPINDWNTSNLAYISKMFYQATSFNQPLDNWDVSNVKYMNEMFCNATSFDQPIGNWIFVELKGMEGLFRDAKSFNQDLSEWDVSNVSTNYDGMFSSAKSFEVKHAPSQFFKRVSISPQELSALHTESTNTKNPTLRLIKDFLSGKSKMTKNYNAIVAKLLSKPYDKTMDIFEENFPGNIKAQKAFSKIPPRSVHPKTQ